MSLNPPIDANHLPTLYRGEVLLLRRTNIRVIAKIGGYKVQSDGVLYTTSLRLCFVADKPTAEFTGLDLPLMRVMHERFNQPIFGCNNLSMDIIPGVDWGNADQFSIKFEFRKGGAQTFLRIFWKLMGGVHDSRSIKTAEPVPAYIQEIASGSFVRSAFIDPTDPTYIYTSQPYQPTYNVPQNYPVPAYYAQPVEVDLSQTQNIPVAQVVQPAQPYSQQTYIQPYQPYHV